jgi:hypothetical protein
MDMLVLRPVDQDAILKFERERPCDLDPFERELASWKARWRPEQLTHYLSLGWSFGAWQDNDLQGYILAQPLLFCRGLTQTLWVEHLSYSEVDVGEELLECAYKWARDKHFQTILISEMPIDLKSTRKMELLKDRILEMPSSRLV